MKTELTIWTCSCGKDVEISLAQALSGKSKCPYCDAVIDPAQEADDNRIGNEETQMVNLQEMARMAQEGVTVEVSGEWDTSQEEQEKGDKD